MKVYILDKNYIYIDNYIIEAEGYSKLVFTKFYMIVAGIKLMNN